MSFKIKLACAASLLAMGVSAQAAQERVIVKFKEGKGPSVKAVAAKAGGDIKVELNSQNAFAVEMPATAIKGLRNNPHVELIEQDLKRYPMAIWNDDAGDPTAQQLTPYAIYQSQANQLSLQSGQKVCVIDSGIAGAQGETGGKNNDFDWSVITGDNDSGTGDWFRDGGPHGTHVAGTVGAADNGIGVVGMAPGVPMHIIKVFNNSGWGYSSDLAYAADKCAQAGANIITMSLGGGGSNSTEENAFNSFTSNGGLVLAAAGNDGNTTRSFPAGYKSVMMVGANDADNNIASFSQYPSCSSGFGGSAETDDGYCVEVTAGGVDTLSTYPAGATSLASASVDGQGIASSAMENNGSASGDAYFMGTAEATDSGANGKVCIIDRGNISFHDKVMNCENSGGLGAIIVNNEPGMLYGTLGTSNMTSIPAVGAALEDRNAIVGAATASVNVGPSDYGYMSGTSMATPGVAGVAALVWSNFPSCTGTEIREALKATAEDQGAAGKDVYFGYGIVKAKNAYDYLLANGCAGGDVNQAPVSSFTYSCTDLGCSFDGSASSDSDGNIASYSWNFGDGSTATGSNPSHTYASAGDYTVTLTVTDNEGATGQSSENVSVTGGGDVNQAPVADYSFNCTDLGCSFDGSASSDSDGSIASYSWNFGEGNTATGATPSHTYASAGDYTVTLTVTDNDGATDSVSQTVSVSDSSASLSLNGYGYKVKGRHHVDLTWSGASSASVDIYRNGSVVATTANDGAYTDAMNNKGWGNYTYKVCEAGTSTCSAEVAVNF